jgi:hypothetical protein
MHVNTYLDTIPVTQQKPDGPAPMVEIGGKAAMKLQFRDVANFIHPSYRGRTGIRYIKKTLDTEMGWECYARMCASVIVFARFADSTFDSITRKP